jgi:hypothetical protein
MLPALFPVASALAKDYAIAHLRFTTSRLKGVSSNGSLFRGAAIKVLETINRRHARTPTTYFLGLETSGKLDLPYLERSIPRLCPGRVYELMCHPGELDAGEVSDRRLLRYHDWEGELSTLTSPAARELLHRHGVELIGYRHLEVRDGRQAVRREPVVDDCSHT